jgi:hypothetical protein
MRNYSGRPLRYGAQRAGVLVAIILDLRSEVWKFPVKEPE